MATGICWLQYTLNYKTKEGKQTFKEIKSDEIVFSKKHVHGIQPTQKDWNNCYPSLISKVQKEAKNLSVTAPTEADIRAHAQQRTRSAA